MGGIFGKPKKAEVAKVPPPAAIPEVDEETGTAAQRAARKKSGFRKTILAGALTPQTGKKTLLG